MANEEHVARLKQGVDAWNKWRSETSYLRPYYIQAVSFRSQAFLEETEEQRWSYSVRIELEERLKELQERLRVGLSGVKLRKANLERADLFAAGLTGADLSEANLNKADLTWASLVEADLTGAKLSEANLNNARLVRASLPRADLRAASLLATDLTNADLTGCRVFGVAAWLLTLEGTVPPAISETPA